MDTMLQHPWTELQVLIKEKWLTQKAFASILWKKISEVNELLKWKRNITIQRDYLLHQALWTPMKYWIMKQIDYDYSLLDVGDYKSPPSVRGDAPKELGGFSGQTRHSEADSSAEESTTHQTRHSEVSAEESRNNENHDNILYNNEKSTSDWAENNFKQDKNVEIDNSTTDTKNIENNDKVDNENWQENEDEDFKERAQIFKSF